MRVRDFMSTPAVTIRSDQDYKTGLRLMQQNAVHHLPVVDADGRVVGIAAERDLLLAATRYLDSSVEVGEVMHRGAVTTRPDAPLATAASLMLEHHIGSLPVIDAEAHVIGLVTETDLFRLLMGAAEDEGPGTIPPPVV
jgi:acetoin utilization protein AcuB